MTTQFPKIVNKQFNSPIKLYSANNLREVLEKETQILANGAVGIDFHQLAKPANLKNSAVLRMLEEEEHRQRNGQPPSLKQVVWPPPQDETEEFTRTEESPVHAQGGPQYHTQTSPNQVHHNQNHQSINNASSPNQQPHSPQIYSPTQQSKGWAPVHSPAAGQQTQPQYYPQPTQAFRPVVPEPPPSTITLRPSPPISQAPAPVYTSQPVTASLKGPSVILYESGMSDKSGSNMRGDQKWPPACVKAQCDQENEQRKQLAKGPACRPRKVKKDYSSFFAQHALNSTYPGYKAPPGTQHYTEEQPGVSNF